jgi:hypothetical protein
MKDNFEWHEVSEEERKEIKKKSKQLLIEFSSKLENITSKEGHLEKSNGYREEGDGWKTDPDFKEIMLANAPFVDGDSIVAEKGSWKK